jgi:hypothetical protein
MLFSRDKTKNNVSETCKWQDYIFQVCTLYDAQKSTNGGIFIFTGKNKAIDKVDCWLPYFIGETENFQTLFTHHFWTKAQAIGATHVHIKTAGAANRLLLLKKLVKTYAPELNQYNSIIQTSMEITMSNTTAEQLNDTKAKLELLFQYEKHYLEMIKTYKEEIKFAASLQEDLRRERSQFFTQTLREVVQTLQSQEIDKKVSAQWIEDLVASYTKSIDLSSDLAKTHVVQVLNIFKEEAKQEVSKAKLDNISNTSTTHGFEKSS